MNPYTTPNRQDIRKEILKSIGNNKEPYPSSELREKMIRAEYSKARFFDLYKKEEIR